jgi:WD40 repeat protein
MYRLAAVSLVVTTLVTVAAAQEPPAIAKHTRWVTDLAFSGDGTLLATVGGESLQYRPGDVKLWDPKTGALTASLEGGHDTNVWSAALSADGKTLVTAGYNGKVIVWDVAEKKARATLDRHKKWCRAVAISPDGSKFATGGEDEEVVIWETAGAKEIKALKAHEKATVYGLAFAADNNTLATCATDKLAKIWDVNAGMEKAKMEHGDAVWAVAWSKDGNLLATCGADRKIKLWNNAGADQGTLEGHKDWVSDVAISPDMTLVASSSHDRTVKLWSVAEKKEVASLGPYKSTVWAVAFSPDGTLLATGSHNDSIKIWNIASKMEVFPAPAAPAAAAAAAKAEGAKAEEKK